MTDVLSRPPGHMLQPAFGAAIRIVAKTAQAQWCEDDERGRRGKSFIGRKASVQRVAASASACMRIR
jgi:hypothetical protein